MPDQARILTRAGMTLLPGSAHEGGADGSPIMRGIVFLLKRTGRDGWVRRVRSQDSCACVWQFGEDS